MALQLRDGKRVGELCAGASPGQLRWRGGLSSKQAFFKHRMLRLYSSFLNDDYYYLRIESNYELVPCAHERRSDFSSPMDVEAHGWASAHCA